MILKHRVANYFRKRHLTDTVLYNILHFGNIALFHSNEKMQKKHYGYKNQEAVFYVIRQHSKEEGLISMYISILAEIEYALGKGWIPFVDLQNNKTQYTTGELIHGTRNAWEYFWNQPSKYDMEEVYKSRNVILSGRNKEADAEKQKGKMCQLLKGYDFMDYDSTHAIHMFIKNNIDIKPYIYESVGCIWKEKFECKNVIGVFARGTDYIAFQPKGHPRQPTKEYVYEKLMTLRKKHLDAKIFLVTEDEIIYSFFKEKLEAALIEIDDIRFGQYAGDDYIFKYCRDNAYQVGLRYLEKLLLLSRCNYLVASIASGSKFANIMNDGRYEERIIIDLGVYE